MSNLSSRVEKLEARLGDPQKRQEMQEAAAQQFIARLEQVAKRLETPNGITKPDSAAGWTALLCYGQDREGIIILVDQALERGERSIKYALKILKIEIEERENRDE